MRALFRYALDGRSCPASGNVVALEDGEEHAECPVCGAPLQLRGKRDRKSGRALARLPGHRRRDSASETREKQRADRALGRADETLRGAVRAYRRGQTKEAARRLRATRVRLRDVPEAHRGRSAIDNLIWRLSEAMKRKPALPRDPRRVTKALEQASNLDLGSIDPAEPKWSEHLRAVLAQGAVTRLSRDESPVRRGIEAVIRASGARTWTELELGRLRGREQGALGFLREFDGLGSLRLPEEHTESDLRADLSRYYGGADAVPF